MKIWAVLQPYDLLKKFERRIQAAPLTISRPLFDHDDLNRCLDQFPDYAMQGMGLGDLSIIEEFEISMQMHLHGHVFIWPLDHPLHCFDRGARWEANH